MGSHHRGKDPEIGRWVQGPLVTGGPGLATELALFCAWSDCTPSCWGWMVGKAGSTLPAWLTPGPRHPGCRGVGDEELALRHDLALAVTPQETQTQAPLFL